MFGKKIPFTILALTILVSLLTGCIKALPTSKTKTEGQWVELIQETPGLEVYLDTGSNDSLLFTLNSRDGYDMGLGYFKNPFSGQLGEKVPIDKLEINLPRLYDDKEVKVTFPSYQVRNESFVLPWTSALTSNDYFISSMLRSPTTNAYAFVIDYGLPASGDLWMLENGKASLLTPHQINEYQYPLSNEASISRWVNDFKWSDDGRKLAYSSNRRNSQVYDLWVIDLETGKHTLYKGDWSVARVLSWPTKDMILFMSFDGITYSLNPETSESRAIGHDYEALSKGRVINYTDRMESKDLVSGNSYMLPESLYKDLPDEKKFSFPRFLGITENDDLVFWKEQELWFIPFAKPQEYKRLELPTKEIPTDIYLLGNEGNKVLFKLGNSNATNSLWLLHHSVAIRSSFSY